MKHFIKRQQGHVIIIALIVVAAVTVLASSLLYVVQTTAQQSRALYQGSDQQALASTFISNELSDFIPENIPFNTAVFEQKTDQVNGVSLTLDRLFKRYQWLGNNLYHRSVSGRFIADLTVTPDQGVIQEYQAIVDLPAWVNTRNQPVDFIPVMVPSVNITQLDAAQVNADDALNNITVGQIGHFQVNGETLEYQSIDNQTVTANLPAAGAEPWHLKVGWSLQDGDWQANLLIFNLTEAHATEVSLEDLQAPNLDTINWEAVIVQQGGGQDDGEDDDDTGPGQGGGPNR